jgi:transcriptional regulator with GAF, ATPase, and Fis domain
LHKDELAALCAFMSASETDNVSQDLISRALETVRDYLQAGLAGYLSLDASDPVPKLIVPRQSSLDAQLSKQLTHMVQQKRRSVWLRGESTELAQTDSLRSFADALCVPLSAAGATLGALHVYRTNKSFTEDDLRFCEVLGDFLAKRLFLLRMRRSLEAENSRLREHAGAASEDRLVGDSEEMNEVRQRILRLAGTNSTVLITGESGVGKELVAIALHRQSPRRDGPLVVVNCSAIAASLAESELFGATKGAFTGADRDRPGYFEQADEGTLFLDEIGELSPECQAKVLRVIEGKGFRKVGGTVELHVDVRVVAATHRNLEREVHKNTFRKDLYYRLGVPIKVPPLRDRSGDIAILVAHFLKKLSAARNRALRVTDEALHNLQGYHWPGNVRQLWKVLENAVDLSEDGLLDVTDLRLLGDEPSSGVTPPLNLEHLEAWAIRKALLQSDRNLSQSARLLGIHRDTLASKMKKYGIEKGEVED